MTVTIRTLLWGRRSSTAIALHVISSHFTKLRGLECRKFEFITTSLEAVSPCIGRIELLVSSTAPLGTCLSSVRKQQIRTDRTHARIVSTAESFAFQPRTCEDLS
jgi:hypothetical protein